MKMKAMVYPGPYKIRVEDKEFPKIEHPNDAIVRVTSAAICGSDLHLYHGMMPDRVPQEARRWRASRPTSSGTQKNSHAVSVPGQRRLDA